MPKENKDHESKKVYTSSEMDIAIEAIRRTATPHTTAPDTNQRLTKLECAIFGDEKLGEIGMIKKIDVIYNFFTGANFSRKLLIWIFMAMGVIAGGLLAFKELFKK